MLTWYKINTLIWKIFDIEEKPAIRQRYTSNPAIAANARVRQSFSTRIAEYNVWVTKTKEEHPIVYFLTETMQRKYRVFLSNIQDTISDSIYWVEKYFIDRKDIVHTTLKRGEDADNSVKMMFAAFNILVDQVEMMLAEALVIRQVARARAKNPVDIDPVCHLLDTDIEWEKLSKKIARHKWTRFSRYRNAKLGLAYLQDALAHDFNDAEENLENALDTLETLVLYIWWTQVRPNRKEPEEVCGLVDFRKEMTEKYGDDSYRFQTKSERDVYFALMSMEEEIYTARATEDDEMFLRLVKHRNDF